MHRLKPTSPLAIRPLQCVLCRLIPGHVLLSCERHFRLGPSEKGFTQGPAFLLFLRIRCRFTYTSRIRLLSLLALLCHLPCLKPCPLALSLNPLKSVLQKTLQSEQEVSHRQSLPILCTSTPLVVMAASHCLHTKPLCEFPPAPRTYASPHTFPQTRG